MQTTYTDRLHTLQIKQITENLVLLAQKIKNIENCLKNIEDSDKSIVNESSGNEPSINEPSDNQPSDNQPSDNQVSDNSNESDENISINIDGQ